MRSVAIMAAVGLSMTMAGNEPAAPADCGCAASEPQTAQSAPLADIDGVGVPAHDPAMAKDGQIYYLFCTGPGISMRSSKDRVHWSAPSRVFEKALPWTGATIPGSRDFYWAPDISYFNHRWRLYYAVSTFGRNRSVIGLATNATLDPNRADYKWIDEGPAFQSYPTDNYNAIDPNIAFDEHKKPWLSFGSFWSGIKILEIDPSTGKPTKPGAPPVALAARPRPGAIEAPFIVCHGKLFYLFTSFDFCCRGVNSTYNIRIGRARHISGQYIDRDGKSMLDGGGSLVLSTNGRWHGPGGASVLRDGRKDYLVYHAYDGEQNGAPKLRIEQIAWGRDGWPTVPTASASQPPSGR